MLGYLCFLGVVLGVRSASAPFIIPCRADDAECLLSTSQAAIPIMAVGVPELGIKTMDPMILENIDGNQGGLTLNFRNTSVTGMRGCTVEELKRDSKKSKMYFTIRCTVELLGDYTLGGQLLIFPISGKGKYKINIRDIIIKVQSHIVLVDQADGKKHWHVDSWRHSSQVKTHAKFQFDNLFNGNRVLAEPVTNFVNTGWREVMSEIAPPIVKAIVSRVVEGVEALFKAVPVDELQVV